MSLHELFITCLIAALILKPTDYFKIINLIRKIHYKINNINKKINTYLNEINIIESKAMDDLSMINYYLIKITNMGINYQGQYTVQDVKKYYQQLVTNNILKDNKLQNIDNHH